MPHDTPATAPCIPRLPPRLRVPATGSMIGTGIMALNVYEYRKDIANLLVTPQIRCRFRKMAVGQCTAGHTHDLGPIIDIVKRYRG